MHALLGLTSYNELAGHPVVGGSFEGFVIANIMTVLPHQTRASFYRSSGGAAVDLLLELPQGLGIWAIEIKRGLSVRPSKGFYAAIADIAPTKCFIVYAGDERYKITENIEAISLQAMLTLLEQSRTA